MKTDTWVAPAASSAVGPRNLLMDNVRGFAILTVVLGHSLQGCLGSGFADNALFRVIYAFHMPLFFFISGYVQGYSSDLSWRKYARRSVILLWPFVVWGLFDSVVLARHPFSALEMLAHGGPVWFLWTLFLLISLLFVVRRLVPRRWVVPVLVLCWVASYAAKEVTLLGLQTLWDELPYLIVGYTCFQVGPGIWRYGGLNRLLGWGSVVLFTAVLGSIVAPQVWGGWSADALQSCFGWKGAVALLGIGSSFWLLSRPSLASLAAGLGRRYGGVTLEIYVIHNYLILMVNWLGLWLDVPLGWRITAAFVVGVLGSAALITWSRRYPWLQGALFGKTAGLIEIKEKRSKRKNH